MTRAPLGACLVATTLGAAWPPAWAEDMPRRRVIEDKAALVQRVLQDSPLARRVAGSASDDARGHLERASESHRTGLARIAEGRLEEGEAALDAAMTSIAAASRLAPDRGRAEALNRARYRAKHDSIEALHEAARRRAAALGGPADPGLGRAEDLIAQATRLAEAGRHAESIARLSAAESALLDWMTRIPGGNVVDYTARFDNAEEELRHESQRFGSYRRLVPIALAELRPAPEAQASVERHLEAAVRLQARSDAARARGDLADALEAIRQGTETLQRALAAAGLVVPTP